MSKILVIGAGYVAGPVLTYLSANTDHEIKVASVIAAESEAMAARVAGVRPLTLDVGDEQALAAAIADSDLVISLVPYQFHPAIAKACIAHQKHLVTASYESEEMKELADAAKAAGITIINEVGLDPGIDHLLAMAVIDSAREQGETVQSFVSWCGGLPSPDSNDNPLGYKFAWSPRAVLLALLNEAQFLVAGKKQALQSDELLASACDIQRVGDLELEGYPNRNSLKYQSVYQLENPETVLRGTLRYRGFSAIMQACKALGLFSLAKLELGEKSGQDITWLEFINFLNEDNAKAKLESFSPEVQAALSWLGIDGEKHIVPAATALDVFCQLLQGLLAYGENERDMVVLVHKFVLVDKQGQQRCVQSSLIEYGDENDSAMAKTVGVPVAIAAQRILSGEIATKGLVLPVEKSVYQQILEALKDVGFQLKEESVAMDADEFLAELQQLQAAQK